MNKKQKQHQAIVPGNALAINVNGTSRDDLSFAMKLWKQRIKSSGILENVKLNREFTKPCVSRRQEKQKAKFIQRIKDLNSF
jgi:ribosomal protein S21